MAYRSGTYFGIEQPWQKVIYVLSYAETLQVSKQNKVISLCKLLVAFHVAFRMEE